MPLVHFSNHPATVLIKRTDAPGIFEGISIKDAMKMTCPSLFTGFSPPWWLYNGHLQTLYCLLGNFATVDRMWYARTYLHLTDGGTLGIDFAPSDHFKLRNDTPIVIIQHGLTGGSYEAYVRAVLSRACAPITDGGLGYRAAVINFRGCAGVPVTSPRLYTAGDTDDTYVALLHIAEAYPDAPLLGVGFSLGANILTRYLAEEGVHSKVNSACALACPWDLHHNNEGGNSLLSSFIGRHVYAKGMGSNILKLLRYHSAPFMKSSEDSVKQAAQKALKLKGPTLEMYDETFTRIAGGTGSPFPFETVRAYYNWSSSHHVIHKITVPFLAINSSDDPIVRYVPTDCGGNGLVVMILTPGGGHLGWFHQGEYGVERWTTKPVLEWLKFMGDDILHEKTPRCLDTWVDEDGFLRGRSRPRLGCKVIRGSYVIDGNAGEDGMVQQVPTLTLLDIICGEEKMTGDSVGSVKRGSSVELSSL
ncbi:hypothetical protein GALMADRAFT_76125 [Galerina marginata CBS 339.88]|uniref:AB hydrolase-1 domain-containing protein n=1 Tax=Galerina marginata (strain CBS 339.88) TaxID=685588 RepID=A0A067SHB1_GALM3|nr:hypothetical protein GALMADRAFT_76125 [Galerina marginata CBS 339.88]